MIWHLALSSWHLALGTVVGPGMAFIVRRDRRLFRGNDWLYLTRRWVGVAERLDGDPLDVIQVDELEAIVKAAAIAHCRANLERGRKFQVHGSSGGKVLRQDRIETALADDQAAPSQGHVRWRAGFHDGSHGAINPVSGEAPFMHVSEHTSVSGLPRKSPKNMAAGFSGTDVVRAGFFEKERTGPETVRLATLRPARARSVCD